MASRLTDVERETIICYNSQDDLATITTAIRSDISELQRKGYRLISVDREFYRFEVPKKYISFRTYEKTEVEPKKKLSEEHKEKLKKGRRKNNG